MKRSDFKIGFSKLTYIILHTTKQKNSGTHRSSLFETLSYYSSSQTQDTAVSILFTQDIAVSYISMLLLIFFIFLNYIPRNSLTTLGISSTSQVAL